MMSTRLRMWVCMLILVGGATAQQTASSSSPACQASPVIGSSDSLRSLSAGYFGDPGFDSAILLATNAHTADPAYKFISDRYHLSPGSHVCIPALADGEHLRFNYALYLSAVRESVLPVPLDISQSLVGIDVSKPVRVVTWASAGKVQSLKTESGGWKTIAPSDLWVTVVPSLKNFCRTFASTHASTPQQLVERLEMRLGLPPVSGKTKFVEITVTNPSSTAHLFRPCASPSVTTTTCALGAPPQSAGAYQPWFLGQYYSSYGTASPNQYPWTSLGYTFDWALRDDRRASEFVRFGESEFVVPKDAPIQIEAVIDTEQYCALK